MARGQMRQTRSGMRKGPCLINAAMKISKIVLPTLIVTASMTAVQAAPLTNHFPEKDLGRFLAEKFDLASIRSSLGPRRSTALRTFADFGMKPSEATERAVVFDVPGHWFYALKVVGRRDVNHDGIEDLEVCFTDRALNGGSYDTSTGLLITRYASDAYAVALSYRLDDDVCAPSTR